MGGEWTTIGEVAQVFDGPHATPKKTDEGPVFLGITSLENGRLDLSKSAHLSEEDFPKWTKRVTPQEGDVVFSYETKLGEAALVPAGLRCCLGRRMGLLRPYKDKVISEYLLYTFLGPVFQQQISEKTNYGSTVNRIALKEFPDFDVRIPSIDEQRSVVSALKSLDDKIELNRKTNETLEAMAQALFKSWFVDFDPVIDNALKAGKPIPEELTQKAAARKALGEERKDLPEDVRRLFPDEFVFCEGFGWVPLGWEVKRLGDVADNLDFKRIPLSKRQRDDRQGMYPYWGASGIVDYVDDYLFDGEFLLVSEDGENLRTRKTPIAFIARGQFWVNNHAHIVQGKYGVSNHHIRLLIQALDINPYITGAVQPKLSQMNLVQIPMMIPDRPVLDLFANISKRFFLQSYSNEDETSTLTAFRDMLLPKFLSGKILVGERNA